MATSRDFPVFFEGDEVKRLKLLKEAFPGINRVAILNGDNTRRRADAYAKEGKAIGLSIETFHVDSHQHMKEALAKILAVRPDALVTVRGTFSLRQPGLITEFALKNRLPAMYEAKEFVASGGLMSYGIDYNAAWRRAGNYIDKILKGENPAILPVVPPQLEFVVNLKVAGEIGVKIPPEILLEANEVIK